MVIVCIHNKKRLLVLGTGEYVVVYMKIGLTRCLFCLLLCCAVWSSDAQVSPIFSSRNKSVNIICDSALNLSKQKKHLQAMSLVDSAKTIAIERHEQLSIAKANATMGWILMDEYNYSLAAEFVKKGLKRIDGLDEPEAKAMLLHQLGLATDMMGQPDIAMKWYLEAQALYKSLKEERLEGQLQGNIGRLYFIAHDYKAARQYYNEGYAKIKDKHIPQLVSDYYNRFAILLLMEGQPEEAYRYNRAGIDYARKNGLARDLSDFYFNAASDQYELNHKQLAETFVDSAIYLAKLHRIDYGQYLGSKAKLMIRDTNVFDPRVEQLFLTGVADMVRSNNKYMEYTIRTLLGDYYKQMKMYNKAAEQFLIVDGIKDSIAGTRQAVALKEVEYKYKDTEKEILLKRYQSGSRLKNGLIVAMFLLAALGMYLLVNARKALKLKQLYFKNKEKLLEQEKANALFEKELEKDHKEKVLQEQQLQQEERLTLEREMASTQRELTTVTIFLQEKNKVLEDLKQQLEQAAGQANGIPKVELQKLQQHIRHSINFDHDWDKVKLHFEKVHPDFFSRLAEICPQLTPNELKHCAYIKMNMSIKEASNLLNIDYNSVKMSRYRIKKKLNLEPEADLVEFIHNIHIAV